MKSDFKVLNLYACLGGNRCNGYNSLVDIIFKEERNNSDNNLERKYIKIEKS